MTFDYWIHPVLAAISSPIAQELYSFILQGGCGSQVRSQQWRERIQYLEAPQMSDSFLLLPLKHSLYQVDTIFKAKS